MLMLMLSVLLLCSCGSETQEVANHERPVFNLCLSINHRDNNTFLNCFVPPAKKAYLSSDSGSKDAVGDLLDKCDIEANDISCEIIGKRELASADVKKLERSYKKEYSRNDEFTKAFQLDVCFTSSKGSDMEKITVVLIDDSWYINSDIIKSFSFGKSNESIKQK